MAETQIGVPMYVPLLLGLGLTAVGFLAIALHRSNRYLRQLSEVDYLTGLFNRKMLDRLLEQELFRTARYDQALSVAMFDIDHFKLINDRFGHQRGDRVLKELARIFVANTRHADTIGRWGGEEFLLLFPSTDIEQAIMAADRIREQVQQAMFRGVGPVTISAGVAQALPGEGAAALIERADAALYRAKNGGRNRVVADRTAPPPDAAPAGAAPSEVTPDT